MLDQYNYKDSNRIFVLVNKDNKLEDGYIPTDLVEINYNLVNKPIKMRSEAAEALNNMMAEGKTNGCLLYTYKDKFTKNGKWNWYTLFTIEIGDEDMQIDFSYNGEKRKEEYIRRVILLLISAISIFFVSRVTLIREVAPFGIALLLILVQHLKKTEVVVISTMSILGYATVGGKAGSIILYISYVITIGMISIILSKRKMQLQICVQYMAIFCISYAYKIIFNNVNYGMGLFLTFEMCIRDRWYSYSCI